RQRAEKGSGEVLRQTWRETWLYLLSVGDELMGGQRQQTQTQTQKTESNPWAPLQPYLTDLWQRGTQAVGQMPTGPNQDQLTAVDWLRSAIPGTSAGSQELRDLGVRTARGDFLDPASNPW